MTNQKKKVTNKQTIKTKRIGFPTIVWEQGKSHLTITQQENNYYC